MSVLSVVARATAARQATVIRPLSPVSCVHHRWLTLSGLSMAHTDLRNIGRDPKLQSNVDPHPSLSSERKSSDQQENVQQGQKAGESLWRWIPNVTEESYARKHRAPTLPPENDPDKQKREVHPDSAPDAQELNERSASPSAEKRSDFEKIRSKIDFENYKAPHRVSSMKEAISEDLEAAKEKFNEVREEFEDLPKKAKQLEKKIESKGAQLASKIKNFVKRDNEKSE